MMSLHTAMLVGLLAPLVVAILTPFLAVRHVWRDAAGPIGGVITFIAAVHVALAVLDGDTPRLFVAQIAEGLALEFAVTPLGA
ncbi:MAG: monovalent cation/H+ antiporter subunit D family protein, partial [Alphaproteobacteria bacterium]|nr:monovalent cation/H+ antiporter subunit D family protein [Alphaproteobacteria bacterium]